MPTQPTVQPNNPIAKICSLLNIDFEKSGIPNDGFSRKVIDKIGQPRQKAKKACKQIFKTLSALLCPEDPDIVMSFFQVYITPPPREGIYPPLPPPGQFQVTKSRQEKLIHSVLHYSLNSHASVSKVAQSLLASSFDKLTCRKMLREKAQEVSELTKEQISRLEDDENDDGEEAPAEREEMATGIKDDLGDPNMAHYRQLMRSKALMGKLKFTSLRSAHQHILKDNEFPPPPARSSRIDARQIQSVLEFAELNMTVRPGTLLRTVQICDSIFEDTPVYERGKLSFATLFERYSANLDPSLRVGINLFNMIIKALMKKGETKVGCKLA